MVNMTEIDEIKARIDIVDLVSETVELRRSGRNYVGFCPFHPNTRTPAFAVWPETGTWRCFGECNDGGDIFQFVMKKEGWDFPGALRVLAERAGVDLTPPTPEQEEQAEENQRLRTLLEDAVTFYRHNLVNAPTGESALAYLRGRGLSDETVEAFGLGYAPDTWEAALTHFASRGYSTQEMSDAGLVTEGDSGNLFDRFRGRVMLPIRDERGRMAGFGARTLDPDGLPKYLNSPQTPVFDKGRILFGLDRARREIRARDQVVIVEGYMGVLAPHQHGYTNVVATMGTAMTEHHLRLIKRYTRRIVLAMDSDAAGMQATLRGLEVARQTLDRERELLFDARGLLRWEGRLQADIRVSTLPEGMDPDDLVNQDAQAWEGLIEAAKPVVMHVMDTLALGRDLDDPKVKTEIAAQVVPLINDPPNPIERDTYRQRLARMLRVDERTLLGQGQFRPVQRRYRPKKSQAEPAPPEKIVQDRTSATLKREFHILGALIRRPDLIYRIDRYLREDGLARLSVQDFENTDHKELFQLLIKSLDQNDVEPLDYVLNHLSDPMFNPTDAILEQTKDVDTRADFILGDVLRALVILREHQISQQLDLLRFLQETAQENGDLKAVEYQDTMLKYATLRGRLHKARERYTHQSLQDTKG
jgi:DNA primase